MASEGTNMNLNVHLRTDAPPEQLVKELLLSPLIYIRLAGILCSIIVFGCVANQVSNVPPGAVVTVCGYNGNSDCCNFAIAVGVLGFLLCLAFLVKDVLFVIVDYSNNIVVKKVILLVDAVTNGLWAFMWFVCFCFTANQLANNIVAGLVNATPSVLNCARSGVAFSFFCILIWGAIVGVNVFYFVRIIRGSDPSSKGQSGYASFPEGSPSDQPYQGDEGDKQYTPPEY